LQYSCANSFRSLVFFFVCLCHGLDGCALAVGPGYTIHKQNLELRFPSFAGTTSCCSRRLSTRQFRRSTPRSYSYYSSSPPKRFTAKAPSLTGTINRFSTGNKPSKPLGTGRHRSSSAGRKLGGAKQKRTLILDYELSSGSHLGSFLAVSADTVFRLSRKLESRVVASEEYFLALAEVPPKKWNDLGPRPDGDLAQRKRYGEQAHRSGTRTGDRPFLWRNSASAKNILRRQTTRDSSFADRRKNVSALTARKLPRWEPELSS